MLKEPTGAGEGEGVRMGAIGGVGGMEVGSESHIWGQGGIESLVGPAMAYN